ncbi:hypothetical protein B0H16DRAFT_303545 [Mycena metata]|uniref:Uncharacterized protein n=1 Tax=Mycena metata TaxID=1033252 RepID=A0AAD7KGB6_9AGAR|nr:hypothetical protein B0H16DRAFT_303545 [Mycena metata]
MSREQHYHRCEGQHQVRSPQLSLCGRRLIFSNRDTIEGTINYGAHSKFVTKWLDKLEAEQKAAAEPVAPAAAEPEPAGLETPVTEALAQPAEVAA